MEHSNYRPAFYYLFTLALTLFTHCSFGQGPDSLPGRLKDLSLEELMGIEVISVSKHPEKLVDAASAIQVITQTDIRQSGAKTLPEALRLAANLQVAQVNASQWAISARGFSNVLANKLLVLIDGRTVYTPLYAGVFWDVQNVLLEDVERIEVISGPGGTLWGANAVNGVINIITKNSADTKGLFAEAAAGSNFPVQGGIRYGAKINKDLSFRVYGTGFKFGNTLLVNGEDAGDDWDMVQGGFRMDWAPSKKNTFSLQANIYGGKPNPDGTTPVIAKGDNAVFRWNHKRSERSDFQLQLYYDHTWRDFRNNFTENLRTYDIDWQHRNELGQRHTVTYGFNGRLMDHTVTNLPLFMFTPGHKTLYLYSLFTQDEMVLVKDKLSLTLGIKVEHNSYTGFEYQPNGRLVCTPRDNQTLWAAVSRAVRTPARIDRDFYLYIIPGLAFISGNEHFISETVMAYELGYRVQPSNNSTLSLSGFYNVYDNIRSAEPGPPPFNIPVTFGNGVKGNTYGLEIAATHQVTDRWKLRSGYTFVKKELELKPGSKDSNNGTAESNDPEHQLFLQSSMEFAKNFEWGTTLRYTDRLPQPEVKEYLGLDIKVGWKLHKYIELDVVAQHLLDSRHPEFIPSSPSAREIQRSIYARIICRL